jgi:hypothetical protein
MVCEKFGEPGNLVHSLVVEEAKWKTLLIAVRQSAAGTTDLVICSLANSRDGAMGEWHDHS